MRSEPFFLPIIVRYALEERRYGYQDDHQPWNKWDMLHIVRFLLQNGARPSINHARNSALACVLRHVNDWEFRFVSFIFTYIQGPPYVFVGQCKNESNPIALVESH